VPQPVVYENQVTTIPSWTPGEPSLPLGYAYETTDFNVHIFGARDGWWPLSPGLTFWEQKHKPLADWSHDTFGATNVRPTVHEAGVVVSSVWRPGLLVEQQVRQAFGITASERRASEQTLYLLLDALQALFLVVEPEGDGLTAYGPRMRELLILACTEVEDGWSHFLRVAGKAARRQGWSTNDYVALKEPLYLPEYKLMLQPYANVPPVRPFEHWDEARPTASLTWYDAYNKTKHDRAGSLNQATLQRCIEAVAANIVLFCVRFGPYPLYAQNTPVASLASHLFELELVDCDPVTFYVPLVAPPPGSGPSLAWGDSQRFHQPWTTNPLVV
jgi:hypothetical protein